MIRISNIIAGIGLAGFFAACVYAHEELKPFSPSDLDPAVREQIAEFAHGNSRVRNSLFVKLQNVFPSVFEANAWHIDWDKLRYRITTADVQDLFGKPDSYYTLKDRPQAIIGLPPIGTDLSKYIVYIYKGGCAVRHYSVIIKGVKHHSDGYFCDVLRFQFYRNTLIDLLAAELPPDIIATNLSK